MTTEFGQNQTMVNLFRDKYLALPGDMPNATQFWGEAGENGLSGDCPGTNAQPSTDTGTCDGNGDGLIAIHQEKVRFWQHLANAGLVEGTYTGVHGPGDTQHMIPGENVRASKFGNAGWGVSNYDNSGGASAGNYALDFDNHFAYGNDMGVLAPLKEAMTPEDAWNIDTKVDDGVAGRGTFIAHPPVACGGGADNTDYDATYNLGETGITCAFRIPADFLR